MVSRYIIERVGEDGSKMIGYDPNLTMMNRKIVKTLLDKILGQYEVFSIQEENHVLQKYRDLAA
jgi:hypothetical protein